MIRNGYTSSKYNLYVRDTDKLLIFNTLTRNIVSVNKEKSDRVESAMKKGEPYNLLEEETKMLSELGFLVRNDVDESKMAQFKYNYQVYNCSDLSLVILPTLDCNFCCVYCPQRHFGSSMKDNTINAIVKFIKRNARKYKRIFVEWFGGEPLLKKEQILSLMHEVQKICERYKIILIASMTTNGYDLDRDTFVRLVDSGIRYYQISIDGNKITHNLSRPHRSDSNSFDRIIGNLREIRNNSNGKRYTIGIRINVSKQNIETINDMVDFYAAEFLTDGRFELIWQWVRDWGGDEKSKKDRNALKSSDASCKKFYEMCVERGLKSVEYMSCKSGLDLCDACKLSGFVINYDGTIYKCAMLIDDKDLQQQNQIGTLLDNGIMKLDYYKISQWMVPRITDKNCEDCVHYPMCMGFPCPLSLNYRNNKICLVDKELAEANIKNICLHRKVPEL